MDLSFHRTILHKFKESQTWLQQFPLRHSDGSVIDLCQLINDNNKPQQLHPAIPSRYLFHIKHWIMYEAHYNDGTEIGQMMVVAQVTECFMKIIWHVNRLTHHVFHVNYLAVMYFMTNP
jgi:hypothetical protein